MICGDKDGVCPIEDINEAKEIAKNNDKIKFNVYEGMGHAFVHRPENEEVEKIANIAFGDAIDFFKKYLD